MIDEVGVDGFVGDGDGDMSVRRKIFFPKKTRNDNVFSRIYVDGGKESIGEIFWPIKIRFFGGSPPPFIEMFYEIVDGDDRGSKIKKRLVEVGEMNQIGLGLI